MYDGAHFMAKLILCVTPRLHFIGKGQPVLVSSVSKNGSAAISSWEQEYESTANFYTNSPPD